MGSLVWLPPEIIAVHLLLAVILFFLVNWIGEHAVDFGYVSTTLFEEPNESVALNFFIRAMSPAVFIITLSAVAVYAGRPSLRYDIYWVAIYYYALRAFVIILLNRQRLISWWRYTAHAVVGSSAAAVAYKTLILPNRSLIPNLEQAGNELWLAILAFLYAVANKVPLAGGPGAKRRNDFIQTHYRLARQLFGHIIDAKLSDDLLRLTAYSVLIYEDYSRPPLIRKVERAMWWKRTKTTGVMQVSAEVPLSDVASVDKGTDILMASWEKYSSEPASSRVYSTIADYNRDQDYVGRVLEVMEILATRIEPTFKAAYDNMYADMYVE